MIEAKRYTAKYIPGTMQMGVTKNGNDQIAIDLQLTGSAVVTAFLNFSEAARPYSEDRLKKLGWPGHGHDLDDTDLVNEVEVDISYRDFDGKQQMDVNIVTDGGRVKLKSTMDDAQRKSFLKRLTGVDQSAAPPKLDF